MGGTGANQHRAGIPSRNTSSPTTLTDLGIKAKQLNETRKLAPVDDIEIQLSERARLLVGEFESPVVPGRVVAVIPQKLDEHGEWHDTPYSPGLHLPPEGVRRLIPVLSAVADQVEAGE